MNPKIFDNLNSRSPLSQPQEVLQALKEYLMQDIQNSNCRFFRPERTFATGLKYYLSKVPGLLRSFLPFLIPPHEKIKIAALKELDSLFDRKEQKLKELYSDDIAAVQQFIAYADARLRSRRIFFYDKKYQSYAWTNPKFPNVMFRYLCYQYRMNPNSLVGNDIEDLKGKFSIIGLGLSDESKVNLANEYFSTTQDPFAFQIPNSFQSVKGELYMAAGAMAENEKLLSKMVEDVIKKYGE